MRADRHEKLERDVARLRELVAHCSTTSIVSRCLLYWFRVLDQTETGINLLSPGKQWPFLLGVAMGTAEPIEPREFAEEECEQASELLNEIFTAYAWEYFPEPGEETSPQWVRAREVAMPAFLEHFNQPLLATTEQVRERANRYLVPFDTELTESVGLSASRSIEICDWISARLQAAVDKALDLASRERKAREAMFNKVQRNQWSEIQLIEAMQQPEYRDLATELFGCIDSIGAVNREELFTEFGKDNAATFWKLYSISRGDLPALRYPTDNNEIDQKSLFCVSEDRAICPLANNLYHAVINRLESQLASAPDRDRFFRRRDRLLEEEVADHLHALLGSSIKLCRSVYETPDNQFEHDIIVLVDDTILVVEAKASPPVEPFRDPDRAYTRLKRAFSKDTGIQKAFDQGKRIWSQWARGATVRLYDDNGQEVISFDQKTVSEVFIVCATRDSHGPLSTDLSLLLEKDDEEPYPWAVNVIDLSSIADAWDYFSWGSERFLEFLRHRITLHGKILTFDELEIPGFYIRHGGLHWLSKIDADRVQLGQSYSEVFTEIYLARQGAREPVVFKPTEPFVSDLQKSIIKGSLAPLRTKELERRRKQGRNERCACESGEKYKRCCGR